MKEEPKIVKNYVLLRLKLSLNPTIKLYYKIQHIRVLKQTWNNSTCTQRYINLQTLLVRQSSLKVNNQIDTLILINKLSKQHYLCRLIMNNSLWNQVLFINIQVHQLVILVKEMLFRIQIYNIQIEVNPNAVNQQRIQFQSNLLSKVNKWTF